MWSTACICIMSSAGIQTGSHSLPSVSYLILFVVPCLEKLGHGSLGTGCLSDTKITLNVYFHTTLFVT
jgi:hypothetical protein